VNIAVTGANGFIGSEVVSQLRLKYANISNFDQKKHNLLQPETLKKLLEKKDAVIHLAGINKDEDITNILRVNVLGTKGLLDAMVSYAPKAKLIFASSFQVYLKISPYGSSKKIAEELIEDYTKRYGIESVIMRMTNVYGIGCRPFHNSAIATFLYQINNNKPININGNGSQRRDYLHVTDAADAIIKSLSYRLKRISYLDICTGKLTSLKEIIEILRESSHKNIDVSYNRKVKTEDWDFRKNYTKAKELLGWKPRISIREGLRLLLNNEITIEKN